MARKKSEKPDVRRVSVALTDQEWRDRAQELGTAQGELEKQELAKKVEVARYNAVIKPLKKRISELAKAVATKEEDREVDDQAGLFPARDAGPAIDLKHVDPPGAKAADDHEPEGSETPPEDGQRPGKGRKRAKAGA